MIFTHEYDFVMKVDLQYNDFNLSCLYTNSSNFGESFLSPKYEETYQNFRARIFLDDLKAFDEICEPYHLKKLASLKEDAYVVSLELMKMEKHYFLNVMLCLICLGKKRLLIL